jgi:DNA mismatch endonuclease, patch repair protein
MAIKVPSFTNYQPVSEATSRVKRANRRRDTLHEILLRRELWRMGLRFRKNVESMVGKPDIVFKSVRVVVFCDGDFWHGRNWRSLKSKLEQGSNSTYWSAKIARNVERDKQNTALLEAAGWRVIRLWETDVKRDPLAAATLIKNIVEERRQFGSQSHLMHKEKKAR